MTELFAMTSEGITRGVFSTQDAAKDAAARMLQVQPAELNWQQDADEEDCVFAATTADEVYVEKFELDKVYYVDEDDEEASEATPLQDEVPE